MRVTETTDERRIHERCQGIRSERRQRWQRYSSDLFVQVGPVSEREYQDRNKSKISVLYQVNTGVFLPVAYIFDCCYRSCTWIYHHHHLSTLPCTQPDAAEGVVDLY